MDRLSNANAFLQACGWGAAKRLPLAGDASDRRYERLFLGPNTAVLMDAPPGGSADDPAIFIRLARHLKGFGLSTPEILAEDLQNGFVLLEDLGDDLFARLTANTPEREPVLYAAATDVLVELHRHPVPDDLPDLTATDWAEAARMCLDWYRFALTGDHCDTRPFTDAMAAALAKHADGERVTILRDYHAENLLWLPGRTGIAKVGVLDFQLAQAGQPGYDLVSMLQDARRDVSPETEAAMITRFVEKSGASKRDFDASYAVLGAQRALRIIGIFARLCLTDAKPRYLSFLPRVWGQLHRNLAHPDLADLLRICTGLLPEPTPERLRRIEVQCGKIPKP
jgi:N-acetylmuramate 1-kinase